MLCAFDLHLRQLDEVDVETRGRHVLRISSHEARGEHPFAGDEGDGESMAAGEALGELSDRDEMAHSRAGKDSHVRLWASHGSSVEKHLAGKGQRFRLALENETLIIQRFRFAGKGQRFRLA
jgi:hypothetical protein